SSSPQSLASWRSAAPSRRSTEWVLTSALKVFAACARRSLSRAARCTRQPSAAKALAQARPMPFEPPVIKTALPFRRRSITVPFKGGVDAGLYHRAGQHHQPREVPGICETGRAGRRQVRRALRGARRREDPARRRHPVPAHRGERVQGRRDGEDVLQLAGIPGSAQAPHGRRRLQHGDRRGRLSLQLLAALLAAASAGAEVPSREVTFGSAGYRLNGTLTLPGQLLGGLLIIPGSG